MNERDVSSVVFFSTRKKCGNEFHRFARGDILFWILWKILREPAQTQKREIFCPFNFSRMYKPKDDIHWRVSRISCCVHALNNRIIILFYTSLTVIESIIFL